MEGGGAAGRGLIDADGDVEEGWCTGKRRGEGWITLSLRSSGLMVRNTCY
jgi:hypothetical protein